MMDWFVELLRVEGWLLVVILIAPFACIWHLGRWYGNRQGRKAHREESGG